MNRLSRLDLALMAALTAAGGALRAYHLTRPPSYFDEGFYVPDACWYVHRSASLCGQAGEMTREHPPLGKWLIGAGIEMLGYHPSGWRITSLAAGTLTIPLLYLLARRLTGSAVAATVSAGLLAVDFLHFLQSRLAMLDVFVAFFGVAALLFAVVDRDSLRAGARARGPIGRPWRLTAGLSAGAAVACKWSGLGILAAVLVLELAWERSAARRDHRSLPARAAPIAGSLLLAPFLVYALSYVDVVHGSLLAAPWADASWLHAFLHRQHAMLTEQSGLAGAHPYQSQPWSWPLVRRPVLYFFRDTGGGVREVLAIGSPLVWWASVPAVGYAAWRWARERDPWGAGAVVTVAVAATYLPWFAVATGRAQLFLYYLLPTVPFMCLALGLVATRLWSGRAGRIATGVFAVAAVLLFGVYYPLLTARPLSRAQWRDRIVFRDCRSQQPQLTQRASPPGGWCWF
ncbi:MAG TPA: phospholipid carrier-dependent glycosyltransferase [Gaiellales bacterium]